MTDVEFEEIVKRATTFIAEAERSLKGRRKRRVKFPAWCDEYESHYYPNRYPLSSMPSSNKLEDGIRWASEYLGRRTDNEYDLYSYIYDRSLQIDSQLNVLWDTILLGLFTELKIETRSSYNLTDPLRGKIQEVSMEIDELAKRLPTGRRVLDLKKRLNKAHDRVCELREPLARVHDFSVRCQKGLERVGLLRKKRNRTTINEWHKDAMRKINEVKRKTSK